MSRLVGDIKAGSHSAAHQERFLAELEALMERYSIDKIDIGWAAPGPCERCGDTSRAVPKDPTSVVEELSPGDPRLEGELKPGLDKSEALNLLDGVVEKMPEAEIQLEIPMGKDEK